MYVDEVANACEFYLRKKIKQPLVNIGSLTEMTIKQYANIVKKKIDPGVLIKFDNNKKIDGVKRKKLDISLANKHGWKAKMRFFKSSSQTIEDFKNSHR